MSSKTTIAALIAAVLLAGCANSTINLRTTNSPSMPTNTLPPGSSYSSAALQADVSPGTYFSVLLFGYLLAAFQDEYRSWRYGPSWRKPPELDNDRSIVEQDCTQPMDRPSANLRCK